MKVNVSDAGKNDKLIEVEVEAEELDKELDKAYRRIAQKIDIPGFRKGRAPRPLVENYVGKGAILEEALEHMIPLHYQDALEQNEIVPVDKPSVEVVEAEQGKPLKFKATVTVMPEVKLGHYKNRGLSRSPIELTDEEIDKELESLRERQAELIEVEGGEAGAGRIAFIEYVAQREGHQVQEAPQTAPVEMGKNATFPELEKALEGAKAGDEMTVDVDIPDDHPDDDVKGQRVQLKVKVLGIKEKRLPELDDEFAKALGGYQGLQDLREDLKNTLTTVKEEAALNDLEKRALDLVVSEAEVDIPPVMIEREIDHMILGLKEKLERANIKIDKLYEELGKDEAAVRDEYRETAEKRVKSDLVIDAICHLEGIKAEEAEVNKALEELGAKYQQKPEIMRKILSIRGGLERLESGIIRSKVVSLIAGESLPEAEDAEKQEG